MKKWRTESKQLDMSLCWGIEAQALTEFIGEFRSWKTRRYLEFYVAAQVGHEQGDLPGTVAFVDTEDPFMSERFYEITFQMSLDLHTIIKNTFVARTYNGTTLCLLIDKFSML
jgi:DNA repair protein RadA